MGTILKSARLLKFKTQIIISLTFGLLCYPSYAAEVLFVDESERPSRAEKQLELACRFYGLDIEHLFVEEGKDNLHILESLERNDALAVVITAQSLPYIDLQEVLSSLQKKRKIPLLITDVTPACHEDLLRRWSDGSIIGCVKSTVVASHGLFRVSGSKDIARELSGQDIPFTISTVYHLILDKAAQSQPIVEIITKTKDNRFPVFVRTTVDEREIFFQTKMESSESSSESSWQYSSKGFLEITPLLMFLRYSCGERCWHSIGHYANFTVDDPWLTEPYGHLSYKGLLEEMEKHNFHTTIAFIPWNFDRSKPEVVSLFSDYPDRFSICIHGNNHDHREFYKYETKIGDPWPARPLTVQDSLIKQAIARMEKFRSLTNLPYDRVMVFPHGIAPEKTLGLLKKYNFLATANADNLPLGSEVPEDFLFFLRPITLQFGNFASLKRYTPNRSQYAVAIDLFLDNPIFFFFSHQDIFKDGIDAFSNIAKMVNDIQPDIEWRSLGNIAQHMYLQKLRDDRDYDVRAFCSSLVLENTNQREAIFYLRKEESFSPPIKQLTVDGQSYPYDISGNEIVLKIPVQARESRHIVIEYENDLDIASIDVSKNDPRVNRLRKLSDFRDMTLSTNLFGRTFIHFYYETDLYKLGLKRLAILVVVLVVIMASTGWYVRKRLKRRQL